ncbi:MAG: hypothetical protein L0H70_06955, partial [Xanthomonadales bacterium]|nr:hypothetical protein [Xanthomonadales bacterium]
GYGLAVVALVYVLHALFGYRGAFWFFVAFYAVMLPLGAIGFCAIYKQRKGLKAVYAADDLRIAEQYAQDVEKFGIAHAQRVRDACMQQSQDSLKEALASPDFRYP